VNPYRSDGKDILKTNMQNKTWPTKKLCEICDLVKGTEPGGNAYIRKVDNAIQFIRVGDLTGKVDNPKFISTKLENLTIVNPDEILITFDGTPGIVAKGWKGAISSGTRVIRNIKQDEILKDFLFYYLKISPVQEIIKSYTIGVTILHASRAIPHIEIPIPPFTIQQKIVERLDAIRKAHELNDRQIALADELFQSLLYKELDPKRKNWGVKQLGEFILVFDRGTSWSKKDEREEKNGIPVLRIPNILQNEIILKDLKFISPNIKTAPILEANDIIMVASNGNPDLVARSALVSNKEKNLAFASFLSRIRFDQDKILPYFVQLFFNTKQFKKSVRQKISTTSGIYNLKKEYIERIKISLPPLETQRQIVEKLQAVQDYKKKLLEQKQKLQELFDSCLDKAMKGELVK